MATKQNITQVIIQTAIEAAKTSIMAVKEAENPASAPRPLQMMPRAGSPPLKQPTFNWEVEDKYQEL